MTIRNVIGMLILSLACALGIPGVMMAEEVGKEANWLIIPASLIVIWAGYLLLTGLMAPTLQTETLVVADRTAN